MTMIGKRDREPSSYIEIAEAISDNGAPGRIRADLAEHELAMGIDSHAPSVDLALEETAPFCRLKPSEAKQIVAEVRSAVVGWQDLAANLGLPAHEIDLVESAFMP